MAFTLAHTARPLTSPSSAVAAEVISATKDSGPVSCTRTRSPTPSTAATVQGHTLRGLPSG